MTTDDWFEAVELALRLQTLVNASDMYDPDFSGLLDLALAQGQVDANVVLGGLVLAASAEYRVH